MIPSTKNHQQVIEQVQQSHSRELKQLREKIQELENKLKDVCRKINEVQNSMSILTEDVLELKKSASTVEARVVYGAIASNLYNTILKKLESHNNVGLNKLIKRVKQVNDLSELPEESINSLKYIKEEFGLQPNVLVLVYLLFRSSNCFTHRSNHEVSTQLDTLENHSFQLYYNGNYIPNDNLDTLRTILVAYHRSHPPQKPISVSYAKFILE